MDKKIEHFGISFEWHGREMILNTNGKFREGTFFKSFPCLTTATGEAWKQKRALEERDLFPGAVIRVFQWRGRSALVVEEFRIGVDRDYELFS